MPLGRLHFFLLFLKAFYVFDLKNTVGYGILAVT